MQQPVAGTLSVISRGPNNALTVSGNVVALFSNGFQIEAGPGIGYFNVFTTASTTYTGAKPYVGENIEAAGTGTPSTSMLATAVSQIDSLLSVSGPIVGMKTGGFQMQGGPGIGYIDIWTNGSTVYVGAKPSVGESVKVEGTGSLRTSLTAVTVTQAGAVSSPSPTPPPATAFMPSSWGKISAFQVFDETGNGYITEGAAQTDGYRYSAVWGARDNIGTSWLTSNKSLNMAYYSALEVDASPTAWGAIGHTLTWWKTYYPTWVLYACTSSGTPTTTPASIPGLDSVPLDIHNSAVVDYQIRTWAAFAHKIGYTALSVDEATFWQADEGVSGGYGCGIYSNGSFVRRYSGSTDPNWANDVVAWVKQARQLLTTDPVLSTYHLKLIVNHPAGPLTTNEETLLANVDADLDETGYSDYGNYKTGSASNFVMTTNWAAYAQKHGTAVLMNQNWGSVSLGSPQLEYSIATYLMGDEQAESLFASAGAGYGLEQYHAQYQTAIGAPCGDYYSAGDRYNPGIYYRRYTNALVVVNGGSGSLSETAYLPAGHTYTDLLGRTVTSSLSVSSNDGYVLLTAGGCQ